MKYIKEIDTVRAISVFLVMISHWLSQHKFLGILGGVGVTIFFVISGYLITRILIYEKNKYQVSVSQNIKVIPRLLKVFYIRRTLRIFPLYYLVLFILVALNFESARSWFGYHSLYLSNFLYSFKIGFDHLSHFWSLAVEEQFYLFWPILIFLLPQTWLNPAFFIGSILFSLVVKAILIWNYPTSYTVPDYMMPSCIECFSMGALVVFAPEKKVRKIAGVLLGFFSVISIIIIISQFSLFGNNFANKITGRFLISCFAASLILFIISAEHTRLFKLIFQNRFVLLIGKISYGIYIYHMFVPLLSEWALQKIHFTPPGGGFLLVLNFILTFIIAYLSFFFFEKPVNNLKERFSY